MFWVLLIDNLVYYMGLFSLFILNKKYSSAVCNRQFRGYSMCNFGYIIIKHKID